MANGNSGCGAILVGLAVLWAVGQCSDYSSPPAPSYERPAVSRAYSPPPADDAPIYSDESDQYGTEAFDDLDAESFEQPDFDAYADDRELSNDNDYTNSRGEKVHSPAYSTNGSIPGGATAVCRDGTYSFSRSRRGTCSYHGGVEYWL